MLVESVFNQLTPAKPQLVCLLFCILTKPLVIGVRLRSILTISESCRCEECDGFFSTRGRLMQHKLKLRYFCCHCSKNFTSVASLKQHQKNADVTMHVCPFCKMFRNVRHFSPLFFNPVQYLCFPNFCAI